MDAADRNLFQIYQSERPDLNKVRVLMRETMECVQHLHEKGLVHGDIKMLNVVRLSRDNKLRLIDLDAAAKVSEVGRAKSYVGSKFSSAVLPPECFAKLNANKVKLFNAYFQDGDDDVELREKVTPKVDSEGTSHVVKTFLVEDGRPKNSGDLPYTLVEASEAVDYWSLGALLFQLVAGKPLVPSNRDDDCVDGNAMAALASWNDNVRKKRLVAIKDPAAQDLASMLLVRDPDERAEFSIADTLTTHPFFKPPKPGDVATQEKLAKIIEQQDKDSKKLDAILSLSKEHREELRKTRQVLLKAVFEATEVSTPTCFVVLNEELPELTADEKSWIEENVAIKDDGTGVEIKGKPPQWFLKLEARFKDGLAWADQLASFKPKKKSYVKEFLQLHQGAIQNALREKKAILLSRGRAHRGAGAGRRLPDCAHGAVRISLEVSARDAGRPARHVGVQRRRWRCADVCPRPADGAGEVARGCAKLRRVVEAEVLGGEIWGHPREGGSKGRDE